METFSRYNTENPIERFKRFREICELLFFHQHNAAVINQPENANELIYVAEHFFGDVARILQKHIILEMAKLFDNHVYITGGYDRENLTVSLIKEDARISGFLTPEVEDLCARLFLFGEKLTTVRNRILAHNDVAYNFSQDPIRTWESEHELNSFNADLREFIERLSAAYKLGPWNLVPNHHGDALDLLAFIRQARRIH